MECSIRNTVKFMSACLLMLIITGCSSYPDMKGMPGYINEQTSSFDNAVELFMEPAYVYSNADGRSGYSGMSMSLFWKSTNPDNVVLEAYVDGARTISTGESLFFLIDGERVGLRSIDSLTNIETDAGNMGAAIPPSNISSKRYLLRLQFLERILVAKDVRVKLTLRRSYVEGVFPDPKKAGATVRQAFTDFLERIKKKKATL